MFSYRIIGTSLAIAKLNSYEARIAAGVTAGLRESVLHGETVVKGYASGPPGPTPRTGTHRRSIKGDVFSSGTSAEGQIGSNVVYAPRLEFGFYGPDALGRVYNQAPRPSFAPAVPEITSFTVAAVSRNVKIAVGG